MCAQTPSMTNPRAKTQLRVVSGPGMTTIYGNRKHLSGLVHRKITWLLSRMMRSTKREGITSRMMIYYHNLLSPKLEISEELRTPVEVVKELSLYFNYKVVDHTRYKGIDRWVLYHK